MRKKNKIPGKRLLSKRVVIPILVSLMIGLIAYIFPVVKVDKNSQLWLTQNYRVIVTSRFSEINSGDLVAFYYDDQVYIQRCIGVEGDTVVMMGNGTVRVNDIELYEPYAYNIQNNSDDIYPFTVPDERYFTVNDDRSNIADSRSEQFGPVSSQQVIGKVVFSM